MFSQLAKRLFRVLPADLFIDHAHYIKKPKTNGFEQEQKHEGVRDCFSPYILVIRKFIDFLPLFQCVLFLVNNVPPRSLEYATYG